MPTKKKMPHTTREARVERTVARTKGRHWQLQDAKARLSQLIKDAQVDGPQIITIHGKETAVIQSMEDYNKARRQNDKGPNLFEALLRCPPGPPLKIHRNPDDVVGAGTPSIFD